MIRSTPSSSGLRKRHAGVDEDGGVAAGDHHHVHAELADAAERTISSGGASTPAESAGLMRQQCPLHRKTNEGLPARATPRRTGAPHSFCDTNTETQGGRPGGRAMALDGGSRGDTVFFDLPLGQPAEAREHDNTG
jgi:hypothetical protein